MKKRCFVFGLLAVPYLLTAAPAAESNGIQWRRSVQEVNQQAKASGKPIMVEFYADWCGYCKMLHQVFYTDPRIISLSEEFVSAQIDGDKETTLKSMYEVQSYPAIIYMDAAGKVLHKRSGVPLTQDDQPYIEIYLQDMAKVLEEHSLDRLQAEIKEKPNDVGLLSRMTVMYTALDDIDTAKGFLARAEKASEDPNAKKDTGRLIAAYYSVGSYYFQQKEYETAIPHVLKYRDIVEEPRGKIKAHFALSVAYIETSQADLAVKELETVLKRTDLNPQEKANAQGLMKQARKDAGLE